MGKKQKKIKPPYGAPVTKFKKSSRKIKEAFDNKKPKRKKEEILGIGAH